jgi:hypothetical protein
MNAPPMTPEVKIQTIANASRVFSPSAPVDKKALFMGRLMEIQQIMQAVSTRGRHAIMFGDRGVGKTSLANILKDVFSVSGGMKIVRINCSPQDTFRSVWLKALAEITVVVEALDPTTDGKPQRVEHTLDNFVHEVEQLGPGELRRLLERWSQDDFEVVIVFDEFDRLPEEERVTFADTIKDLSDHSVYTTLILVGVASDVNDLFGEHESIDRCLEPIKMPIMSDGELKAILITALSSLKMSMGDDEIDLIVSLSQGFPHYTHLLGQESVFAAINEGSWHVTPSQVRAGIVSSLAKTDQKIRSLYHNASVGQRKGALFPQVLLACAVARVDDLGYFRPADVRDPLCKITGKEYDIPNFAQHLDKFANDESRGPILEKAGTTRRFKFKFLNPLLRPFVIMKGLTDGLISGDLITQLRKSRPVQLGLPNN